MIGPLLRCTAFEIFVWSVVGSISVGMAMAEKTNPQSTPEPIETWQQERASSSMHRLGDFAAKLPINEPSVVVVGPVMSETLDSKGAADLHNELVSWVASQVPSTREVSRAPLSVADARRLARQSNLTLAYFSPRIHGGQLRVTVRLLRWPRSFWQKAVLPRGQLGFERAQAVPLDAMIRRHFRRRGSAESNGPIGQTANEIGPTELNPVARSNNPLGTLLGMACADLDFNGSPEIVLLGRREIGLGAFSESGFIMTKRRNWSSLSPLSSTPLRAPLGAIAIFHDAIWLGSSDRAHSVVLDDQLRLREKWPRQYPLEDGRCALFTGEGLGPPQSDCGPHPKPHDPANSWDVIISHPFVERTGAVSNLFAALGTGQTESSVVISGPSRGIQEFRLSDVGAQFAFSDFDGDGQSEMLTTGIASKGTDAVIIHALSGDRFQPRYQITTPAPIRALTTCPFLGQSPPALVVATDSELWRVLP
jgi:hypothetical protein